MLLPFVSLQSNLFWFVMVSVMSVPCYVTSASSYQSRPSMYIQGLDSTELAKAVPIYTMLSSLIDLSHFKRAYLLLLLCEVLFKLTPL